MNNYILQIRKHRFSLRKFSLQRKRVKLQPILCFHFKVQLIRFFLLRGYTWFSYFLQFVTKYHLVIQSLNELPYNFFFHYGIHQVMKMHQELKLWHLNVRIYCILLNVVLVIDILVIDILSKLLSKLQHMVNCIKLHMDWLNISIH